VGLLVASLGLLMIGCESGGSDDSSETASTLTGRIAAYEGESGAGISVSVVGSGSSTIAASDGSFVLFNLSSGVQFILFAGNDGTALLQVDIPDDSIMELTGIRIVNGAVSVDSVHIEPAS